MFVKFTQMLKIIKLALSYFNLNEVEKTCFIDRKFIFSSSKKNES